MTHPLQGTLENRDGGWVLRRRHSALAANGVDRPRVVGQDAEQHGWEALRDKYSDALGD